jgi:molybdenum cofactor biosynthesis enzyme MoaA
VISADVKLNNTCNFACAMCNPESSSKIFDHWKSDTKSIFVQQVLSQQPNYFEEIVLNYQSQRGYQHLIDILKQPIRHLKILGGEPLLDKQLLTILTELDSDKKAKINLHFVTNGSQDLATFSNMLSEFCSLHFTVSLEGIGAVQDYIRKGSDWKQIEKNILVAKKQGISLNIAHTLQAMSILGLDQLIYWSDQHHISISYSLLSYPDYLSISVLPEHLRQLASDRINKSEIKKFIQECENNSNKYEIFIEYIKWFEEKTQIKLKNIFPKISY